MKERIYREKQYLRVDYLPREMKWVGVKWIFKTKFKENREIDKFKTSLEVKGILNNMD